MSKIWIAHMATGHYEFYATGKTEAEAVKAIRNAWDKHAKQCELPSAAEIEQDNGCPFTEYYGVYTASMALGGFNIR